MRLAGILMRSSVLIVRGKNEETGSPYGTPMLPFIVNFEQQIYLTDFLNRTFPGGIA
jgi:hypothetical protein